MDKITVLAMMGMCVCVLHVCTRFYYLLILFQICLVDFSVIQIIIPGKQVAVNFDPQLYPLKASNPVAWKMLLSYVFQVQSYHVFMLSRILGMPQTPGSDPPIFSGFSDPILEESRSDLLGFEGIRTPMTFQTVLCFFHGIHGTISCIDRHFHGWFLWVFM